MFQDLKFSNVPRAIPKLSIVKHSNLKQTASSLPLKNCFGRNSSQELNRYSAAAELSFCHYWDVIRSEEINRRDLTEADSSDVKQILA
ncbi:hypothetical protein AVEN_141139-1 [Araneus ventricosus]|uniref:Uncharacterized protein n=1 Tax=Araneus ventricosus TaxID=182803 RepID=A0A4Y2TQE0_ARAVE|nr:hypothetical protein AVEN_141139-1 [Araneus ventricosus]